MTYLYNKNPFSVENGNLLGSGIQILSLKDFELEQYTLYSSHVSIFLKNFSIYSFSS